MKIESLDHLVLTVKSIRDTCDFYTRVLGMEVIRFGENRTALRFGKQKINLHEQGKELTHVANKPMPGSADLCFVTKTPVLEVLDHLVNSGVPVEFGPVPRDGAQGAMKSVYFRDPDLNLIEVSRYD
jgi:catechol 2,3-dioxygenase-like lactoylglutathione lyase family enzyme